METWRRLGAHDVEPSACLGLASGGWLKSIPPRVPQESPKVTVLGADRPFEHLHTSSTADQKLIPPTTPYPDQRKTYTLYYPLPSTTPYTLYYPLPQNIHGAAPPRLSHPTAPPDPRQPYPTAPLPLRPHPKPPPPDAQPHRAAPPNAVHRGTHADRSVATVPVPQHLPLPRKVSPRSNRAAPREAWGQPQSASF